MRDPAWVSGPRKHPARPDHKPLQCPSRALLFRSPEKTHRHGADAAAKGANVKISALEVPAIGRAGKALRILTVKPAVPEKERRWRDNLWQKILRPYPDRLAVEN